MTFLYPFFLFAGFVVLIPLIIHLFNFRKYKVLYFSDTRFLNEIRTHTRARNNLKQILVLILRMLIIASLVIAFAQPVINTQQSDNVVVNNATPVIYVDNSFLMQSSKSGVSAFEIARQKAIEITSAYPADTRFLLITDDFNFQHLNLVDASRLRLLLQDLKFSPVERPLSQVVEKARQNLDILGVDYKSPRNFYLISNFPSQICDFENFTPDSLLTLSLVKIPVQNSSDLSIDTCYFSSPFRYPHSLQTLSIFVKNDSENSLSNISLRLFINNNLKTAQSFDIGAHERKELSINYINNEKNIVYGRLEIDDYPVMFDNSLYFSYKSDSVINIAVCGNSSSVKYFNALFDSDKDFSVKYFADFDNTDFSKFDAVILNQPQTLSDNVCLYLHSFVSEGGNLIFVPSADGNISQYNRLLSMLMCNTLISADTSRTKVSSVNIKSFLLRDAVISVPDNADLPFVKYRYTSSVNAYPGEEVILETFGSQKLVTSNSYQSGRIVVFYCPINSEYTDIASNRIFVPVIYNACALSSVKHSVYSVVGDMSPYEINVDNFNEKTRIAMRNRENNYEFIPRISNPDASSVINLFADDFVKSAGFYDIIVDDKIVDASAFNYSRLKSVNEYSDNPESELDEYNVCKVRLVDAVDKSFVHNVADNVAGKRLWKLFIFLSLIFLSFEVLILKFL